MKTDFKSFKNMAEDERDAYGVLVKQITDKVNENILNSIKKI